MNIDKVKEILELVEKSPLENLEIEVKGFGGRGVRVRKGQLSTEVVSTGVNSPKSIQASEGQTRLSASDEDFPPPLGEGMVEITSPIVGTFYRAPSPDSPPYIEEGESIVAGQVVCIVEAMKLMNEIQSEVSGVVKKILVKNAQPVEFGQVLFIIKVD